MSRAISMAWVSGPRLVGSRCRLLRFRLPLQSRNLFVDVLLLLPGEVANIDHLSGLKRPDKRLHPRHNGEESEPAHRVDCVGIGMLPGNSDPPRQTEDEHRHRKKCPDQGENDRKGQEVPNVQPKAKHADRPLTTRTTLFYTRNVGRSRGVPARSMRARMSFIS